MAEDQTKGDEMTKKSMLHPSLEAQLTESAPRETFKAKPRIKAGKNKTNITYFVSLPTHRRLKEVAFARGTSLQQIIDEAVDEWLARHLEDPIDK